MLEWTVGWNTLTFHHQRIVKSFRTRPEAPRFLVIGHQAAYSPVLGAARGLSGGGLPISPSIVAGISSSRRRLSGPTTLQAAFQPASASEPSAKRRRWMPSSRPTRSTQSSAAVEQRDGEGVELVERRLDAVEQRLAESVLHQHVVEGCGRFQQRLGVGEEGPVGTVDRRPA